MTRLRQRFIDDLRLKNFSHGTIKVYVHAVEKFAQFLGRSPDKSTAEDVRAFLIHELDRGLSRSYCVIRGTSDKLLNVELNRYAVGAGELVGVGPRFVSCESDSLAGSGCID